MSMRSESSERKRQQDRDIATMMICRLMTAWTMDWEGTVNCFRSIESPIVVFHLARESLCKMGLSIRPKYLGENVNNIERHNRGHRDIQEIKADCFREKGQSEVKFIIQEYIFEIKTTTYPLVHEY